MEADVVEHPDVAETERKVRHSTEARVPVQLAVDGAGELWSCGTGRGAMIVINGQRALQARAEVRDLLPGEVKREDVGSPAHDAALGVEGDVEGLDDVEEDLVVRIPVRSGLVVRSVRTEIQFVPRTATSEGPSCGRVPATARSARRGSL